MRQALAIVDSILKEEQLRLTEVEIAGLLREEQWDNEDLWSRAENFGLAVIANLEERVDEFDPDQVDGSTERLISLSAYVLWSCAQRRFSLQDTHEAAFLALNAAILFLYAANISGAVAITTEIHKWNVSDPVFLSMMGVLISFNQIPRVWDRRSQASFSVHIYYRNALNRERSQEFDLLHSISQDYGIPESAFSHAQIALVYRLEQAIPWLVRYLLPDLIDEYIGESTNYSNHIRANGPFFAFPSQRYALKRLSNNKSVNTLITFPTSTGKTFLGECFALYPLLVGRAGVAVYIAPYRAIVTQVVDRAIYRAEAADITIVPAMGGYLEGLSDRLNSTRVFLVATLEAFDYALRSQPNLKNRIVSITIDEMHLLEQPGRGTLLECLVGRLRDLQSQTAIRIIGLSAVIEKADVLQQWLNVPEIGVLRTAWSPTRKRFEIQMPNNRTRFYGDPSDGVHASEFRELEWNISSNVPKIPYQFDKRRFSTPKYARMYDQAVTQIFQTTAKAAAQTYARFRGPVLIVCSSRSETRTLARHLVDVFEVEPLTDLAQELSNLLKAYYPHHRSLLAMLPYRVCYHNSDIEYDVRDKLQILIERKYFKVVVATTTLAEGVDLPFRSVIMHRWTHFNERDRENPNLFSTLLMRNIVGRCGRAGMFVEGDTIFIDNPIDDKRYPRTKTIEYQYIQPRQIALQSSLELTKDDEDIHPRIAIQLESALLALIDQRSSLSEPTQLLRDLLLCDKNSSKIFIRYLDNILQSELDKQQRPLLVSNSPITLTIFGRTAVETGLSIKTSADIVGNLDDIAQENSKATKNAKHIKIYNLQWNGLFEKAWQRLGDLRELDVQKRPCTKADFPLLVWAWYSGWSIPAIVWLTHYRSEIDKETDVAWLKNPTNVNSELEDKIAEMRSFCDAYFGRAWSRILRAIASFIGVSEIDNRDRVVSEYQKITPFIQSGVSSYLATQLVDKNVAISFPGDRTQAQIVSLWYYEKGINDISDLQFSRQLPSIEDLCNITLDQERISNIQVEAANEIRNWLVKMQTPVSL